MGAGYSHRQPQASVNIQSTRACQRSYPVCYVLLASFNVLWGQTRGKQDQTGRRSPADYAAKLRSLQRTEFLAEFDKDTVS